MRTKLTLSSLREMAHQFCLEESSYRNPDLFGVTDGKAVGTYVEHKFQTYLSEKYMYERGSSAKGIDLPDEHISTDIKVTSIRQPQSSCPFRDVKQKIFGLGYNLLIFVYDKADDPKDQTTTLSFISCTFLEKERTADYTTTFRLREMIKDGANVEDVAAYLQNRNIPADAVTLHNLAQQILNHPPKQGYLTISNALQWRLQYGRVVKLVEEVEGIHKLT